MRIGIDIMGGDFILKKWRHVNRKKLQGTKIVLFGNKIKFLPIKIS